jgi:hypothetical protein
MLYVWETTPPQKNIPPLPHDFDVVNVLRYLRGQGPPMASVHCQRRKNCNRDTKTAR